MAKRGTRKTRRGGAWYNPLTWFASAPAPAPIAENPPVPSESPSVFSSSGPTTSLPGGKKGRKTRRGGRRHSKAAKIYRSH